MTKSRVPTGAREAKQQGARIQARLSSEDKTIIQRAAKLRGCSLSAFVVESSVAAAEAAIRRGETIVLSERDSIMFVEAILNPKNPNEALRKAFRLHQEQFGEPH